jgi:hypothetical protein
MIITTRNPTVSSVRLPKVSFLTVIFLAFLLRIPEFAIGAKTVEMAMITYTTPTVSKATTAWRFAGFHMTNGTRHFFSKVF